jgi:TatD DNase family protein
MDVFIDSHAHLEMRDFDEDREEVIKRAREAGVAYIITVGTTLKDCEKAVDIANQYEAVYASIGIHPHDAIEVNNKTYDTLRNLAKTSKKVVAYGEIGLDFFRKISPRQAQISRFGEQLDLAADMNLPVIIHDREAHRETLETLAHWKGNKRGIIHCFSGDKQMAKKCLDMGFYISISGAVTFDKSERLHEIARYVSLTSLLIETDAPFLTPHPHRGERNEPSYVVHTAAKVALLKDIPLEEVGEATSNNAKTIFEIA